MAKTILVTGGAGFVGSHLVEALAKDQDNRVIVLDNYFTGSKDNHIEGVKYVEGHTKDIAALIDEKPDIVFHLGEYARVEKSFEDVATTWDLNIPGTFAVLEFCRERGSKLVYAGSSTKFADGGTGRDQSPYAWTKATNTELVRNYGEWYGLEYAITYFYNVYGPREMSGPYGTLVRIFTELYRNGQPLTVVLPGTQRRNFTHVSDIVAGLLLVAEKGRGDGFGIGADQSYSVMEVAEMFGGETVLMPERKGNRLSSAVDSEKTQGLGWRAKRSLPEYIKGVKKEIGDVQTKRGRVMVFTTTFHPIAGPAEHALLQVMKALPSIHFDVITTKFDKNIEEPFEIPNVTVHRLGHGSRNDKFLLPILGARFASKLSMEHQYMFKWSLFASYGALAALFARRTRYIPLLVTLADQKLGTIPWHMRFVLRHILHKADQVHATSNREATHALTLAKRTKLVRSIGEGDAFANQVRIAYSRMLEKVLNEGQ